MFSETGRLNFQSAYLPCFVWSQANACLNNRVNTNSWEAATPRQHEFSAFQNMRLIWNDAATRNLVFSQENQPVTQILKIRLKQYFPLWNT